MRYFIILLLLALPVFAESLPDSVVLQALNHIEAEGMSRNFLYSKFNLIGENIDSYDQYGWTSGELVWNVQLSDDIAVPYSVKVYKTDSSFVATSDYFIDREIAFLFPTKQLHDIQSVISLDELNRKITDCLKELPLVSYQWSTDGMLYALAGGKMQSADYPRITVNIQTGETLCERATVDEKSDEPISWWNRLKIWFGQLFT